jgi:hypothetical protein
MPEITLESLAARLDVLEKRLDSLSGVIPPTRDWRSVVGMFDGSEFMPLVDQEIQNLRARGDSEPQPEFPS